MKLIKKSAIFWGIFLVYHIIGSQFFPVDENNVLQAPDWYIVAGLSVSLFLTALITRDKSNKKKISEKRKQKEFDSLPESEQWKIQRNLQENPYQVNVAAAEWSQPKIMLGSIEDLAVKTIFETGLASVSMLERRLKLGDKQAASIIDHLEGLGIVGPFMGSTPRAILISEEQYRDYVCVSDDSREVLQDDPAIDYDKIIEDEEEWRREQTGLSGVDYEMAKVDSMEGHAFEYWCAELLRENGFESVEVTQGSGDQGVDVLARKGGIKYAIQCKCYSKDLGNTPVQEVNTGKMIYHCQIGAVMTNRYFTQGGKDAAEATGVLLWDRDKLVEMLSQKT